LTQIKNELNAQAEQEEAASQLALAASMKKSKLRNLPFDHEVQALEAEYESQPQFMAQHRVKHMIDLPFDHEVINE